MQPYLDTLKYVYENGTVKKDRTGTGTISTFGEFERYDLRNNRLPLITTKSMHLPTVIHELLWMLSGDTDVGYLIANGVRIWNEWVDPTTAVYDNEGKLKSGNLNKVYGQQWRNIQDTRILGKGITPNAFQQANYIVEGTLEDGRIVLNRTIDQIQIVLDQLKNDPDSRRILLSAWHVPDIDQMSLAPCHHVVQFYTRELSLEERQAHYTAGALDHDALDGLLVPRRGISSMLTMRSNDIFLGKPYNIAFYSLLTHALAMQFNFQAEDFVIVTGDSHVYSNHVKQTELQLSREPHKSPEVTIESVGDIRRLVYEDFTIHGYTHHPHIPAKVAV